MTTTRKTKISSKKILYVLISIALSIALAFGMWTKEACAMVNDEFWYLAVGESDSSIEYTSNILPGNETGNENVILYPDAIDWSQQATDWAIWEGCTNQASFTNVNKKQEITFSTFNKDFSYVIADFDGTRVKLNPTDNEKYFSHDEKGHYVFTYSIKAISKEIAHILYPEVNINDALQTVMEGIAKSKLNIYYQFKDRPQGDWWKDVESITAKINLDSSKWQHDVPFNGDCKFEENDNTIIHISRFKPFEALNIRWTTDNELLDIDCNFCTSVYDDNLDVHCVKRKMNITDFHKDTSYDEIVRLLTDEYLNSVDPRSSYENARNNVEHGLVINSFVVDWCYVDNIYDKIHKSFFDKDQVTVNENFKEIKLGNKTCIMAPISNEIINNDMKNTEYSEMWSIKPKSQYDRIKHGDYYNNSTSPMQAKILDNDHWNPCLPQWWRSIFGGTTKHEDLITAVGASMVPVAPALFYMVNIIGASIATGAYNALPSVSEALQLVWQGVWTSAQYQQYAAACSSYPQIAATFKAVAAQWPYILAVLAVVTTTCLIIDVDDYIKEAEHQTHRISKLGLDKGGTVIRWDGANEDNCGISATYFMENRNANKTETYIERCDSTLFDQNHNYDDNWDCNMIILSTDN